MRVTSWLRRRARAVRRARLDLAARLPQGPSGQSPDVSGDMDVLLLGSTGRSGTSITAYLLGAHPAYARIPIEAKFLGAPGGLAALAAGWTTYQQFERKMLGKWFDGQTEGGGLQAIMDRVQLEAALPILRDGLARDRLAACRRFTHALFDPIARAKGARGWIEKSPTNVRQADLLYRIFPNMKFVHLARDGRDVAASVVPLHWGASELDSALDWWARRAERGFKVLDRIPPERVLHVQMEDLILRQRDREYERLLRFVGLEDDPAMRTFFDKRMTEREAHIGRWREDVPVEQHAAFEAHHARLAARFRARGRPYAPMAAGAEPAQEPLQEAVV